MGERPKDDYVEDVVQNMVCCDAQFLKVDLPQQNNRCQPVIALDKHIFGNQQLSMKDGVFRS